MKHLGDITKLNGAEIPAVDVICGGSPCQDLSVAGKRAGLAGERSGLFMDQIRIIKEMRENDRRNNGRADEFIRPRYMVWENVPGAFSSNKGEDFRAVLEETARVADKDAVIPGPPDGKWTPAGAIMGDGWSIAWRVHDAQFWGLAQRRKRIALVADFGGQTAPEILFERESLPRNTQTRGKEGEGIAEDIERCAGEAGKCLNGWDIQSKHIQPEEQAKISDKVGALNCMHDQQAIITYGLDRASYNQGQNAKFDFCIDEEKVGAQTAKGPGAVCQSVVRRLTPLECERLQGYPDGWTDIGNWLDSRGKTHKGEADAPRYKALGNSIALPFWQWMAERMMPYLGEHPNMASLFDGIGGFPLVFSRCGCEPVWASEVEEFCIAVTKRRFGDE